MLNRRTLASLFLIGALTTLLILPGGNRPVSDAPARLGVAHWLWTGQPPLEGLETTAPIVLYDRAGNIAPWFGIGQSLVLLPADILATALGFDDARSRFIAVQYVVFPILNGMVVASAALLLMVVGAGGMAAVAGAISLAFGSTVLWHFQNNQENPMQFLLLLWALIGVFRWNATGSRHWLLVSGVCLGSSLLIRLPTAVDALIVSAVPLAGPRRREYVWAWAQAIAPCLAAGVLIDRLYHFARFGEWTSTYMHMMGDVARDLGVAVPAGFPFSNPFWSGFAGPFLSLQESIFLFDPLLLATMAGLALAWRRTTPEMRLLAAMALAGIILTAATYATFFNWGGFSSWGDRFLTTWVWVACLLAVPLLLKVRMGRASMTGVAVIVVSLQLLSITFPSWLEEVQLDMGTRAEPSTLWMPDERIDHFVIGQRVKNVLGARMGDGFMLVPLTPLSSLPPTLAVAARLTWLSAAFALAWLARHLLRTAHGARSS